MKIIIVSAGRRAYAPACLIIRTQGDRDMLQISGLKEGLEVFKALGSEARMKIVELLSENGAMNLNEIAGALQLTNGAVTAHVKKLEDAGIITVTSEHTGRGMQKKCSLNINSLLLAVEPAEEAAKYSMYETEIEIGHYTDYSVRPGCGLAGVEGMIGNENDSRCFAYPDHLQAQLLWFHDGYIEYRIPNLLPAHQKIVQLTLSFEVSAADQGMEEGVQEDVTFSLNGHKMGDWLSIEDPDRMRGIFTPLWFRGRKRQHGYLKMIVINLRGVFLDGAKITDLDTDFPIIDENGEMRLRIETHSTDGVGGGIALYGAGFGNYQQSIRARIHYIPEDSELLHTGGN